MEWLYGGEREGVESSHFDRKVGGTISHAIRPGPAAFTAPATTVWMASIGEEADASCGGCGIP